MLYFIFAVLIVLLDQAVKYLVTLKLTLGGEISLIPGVIHLTYIRNTGAAFSTLSEYTWLLIIISALAIVLIVFVIIKFRMGMVGRLALAAVLGGALGNLIDRATLGYVVDMFEVEFLNGTMFHTVFNVADSFITVGGIVFCIYYVIFMAAPQRKKKKEPTVPPIDIFGEDAEWTDSRILTEYDLERMYSDKDFPDMPPEDDDFFGESPAEDDSGKDES